MAKKKAPAKRTAAKKSAKNDPDVKAAKALLQSVPDVAAAVDRLLTIEDAEKLLAAKQRAISRKETEQSELKSQLSDVNDELSDLRAEERELQRELQDLCAGKFSEKLPFARIIKPVEQKPVTASGPAQVVNPATTPAANPDGWRKLKLTEMGLTDKRALKALEDAGIETFGDAEDRLASNKPIPNFGDGARQKYDDAKVSFFANHPEYTTAPGKAAEAKPTTAPGDKPGQASRGAAVDREKKALTDAVDNALAFNQQEVTPENGNKVLAHVIGADPVAALEKATLDQLREWQLKVRNIDGGEVVKAVRSTYALN